MFLSKLCFHEEMIRQGDKDVQDVNILEDTVVAQNQQKEIKTKDLIQVLIGMKEDNEEFIRKMDENRK